MSGALGSGESAGGWGYDLDRGALIPETVGTLATNGKGPGGGQSNQEVDASYIIPETVGTLDPPRQLGLQRPRGGRRQVPRVRLDRSQRHRRARASSMIRSVSDHSPSPASWSSANQRASAASSPGTSSALCASAV